MTEIRREQRRRVKGYRQPPGCYPCTRPGPLGNPFNNAYDFRLWAEFSLINNPKLISKAQRRFRAKFDEMLCRIRSGEITMLSCYCDADSPDCHLVPLIKLLQERL